MIFGFAFQLRNMSTRALYAYPDFDQRSLLWKEPSITKYLRLLLDSQPDYIIGLGIYTGIDQNKVRIETITTNRRGKQFLDGDELQSVSLNHVFAPGPHSKLAHNLGNSYCNLVSWRIMRLIQSGQLRSHYSFLHLPKKMDETLIQKELLGFMSSI